MNYKDATAYLESLEKFGINLGLSRVRLILSRMGDPNKKYDSIVVGGTNGKGSVVAMLSSILTNAGLKVGAYTSPHLLEYTERIRVCDADISKTDFARAINCVKKIIDEIVFKKGERPTVFEVITAAALWHFASERVALVILEVGLGGRLDATNVVDPLLSVITNVDLDHTEVLGKTIEMIAREKAGIIRPGVPVVTAARGEALQTIKRICKSVGAALVAARGKPKIPAPLIGEHQRTNLAIVLSVLDILRKKGIKVSAREVRGGLKATRWRGRFDIVFRRPLVVLDGAHNPAGANALAGTLRAFKMKRPLTVVLGILARKDVAGIVKILAPISDKLIATRSSHSGAASPSSVAGEAKKFNDNVVTRNSVSEALKEAFKGGADQSILVAGSLFTVSDALKALKSID